MTSYPRFAALVVSILLTGSVPSIPAQRQPTFARIAVLRPHDGKTVDFEAGYLRHLEWHRLAKDPWSWYGWTVWAGERQRWFVYATFGRAAADFDASVAPADDERDNIVNVTPHAQFVENRIYEFLPQASRGTGVPRPAPRLELLTVELTLGAAEAFETGLQRERPRLDDETLWYRLVAGGRLPRYIRLRSRPTLAALVEPSSAAPLPESLVPLAASVTTEMLNLRPTLSYGLPSGQ